MPFDVNVLFNNAAAQTATGNSAVLDLGPQVNVLTYEAVVTAFSGTTPTLALKLQGSPDNTNWYDLATLEGTAAGSNNITGKITRRRKVKTSYRYFRESRTIGGTTPSFTYTSGLVLGGRDKNIG